MLHELRILQNLEYRRALTIDKTRREGTGGYGQMKTAAQYNATLSWDRDLNLFFEELAEAELNRIRRGLESIIERYKVQIEQWMRQNAKWTDRTGNARRGLHAEVEILGDDIYSIVLDHADSVSYGVWLELRWHGKYAIIQPALDTFAPLIFAEVRRLVDGR
jgi:hypothetical protein